MCSFVIIVDYVSARICIRTVVLYGETTAMLENCIKNAEVDAIIPFRKAMGLYGNVFKSQNSENCGIKWNVRKYTRGWP